ncbi:hypothetical protein [Novosphingobium sp. P6W]|uniref:hypothetical protein n=1 Tax=Novosphingobium sp. P6W TaxID=1609758 RepID=UPI000AA87F9A|nr:hypothetical protein [Novosphingobium sp. P6W]
MTEFKHNIDWRHGFSPFLGVERFVERAEAARNAISEQASAARTYLQVRLNPVSIVYSTRPGSCRRQPARRSA